MVHTCGFFILFYFILFKAAGNLCQDLAPLGHVRVQRRVCLHLSAPSCAANKCDSKNFFRSRSQCSFRTLPSPCSLHKWAWPARSNDDTLCQNFCSRQSWKNFCTQQLPAKEVLQNARKLEYFLKSKVRFLFIALYPLKNSIERV